MNLSVSRRKQLALIGTAAAGFTSGCANLSNLLQNGSSTNPDSNSSDPDSNSSDPDSNSSDIKKIGENITDYGAEPNPTDPGLDAAKQNRVALHNAAHAAGEGGTIYVPEGMYYFGHPEPPIATVNIYGRTEPAGISIIGDGPNDSILAVTKHMPDNHNHSGFYWLDGLEHGQVEVSNIRLDGNYENLGDLVSNDTGARGCLIGTGVQGMFTFLNVHFRGWYTMGLWNKGVSGVARRCTFEEIALGVHEDSDGSFVSHGVGINNIGNTDEFVFERCLFSRISGDAVNLNSGTGTVTLRWCYGESLGNGVHKMQFGGVARHEHCYWEPHTQWLVDNLPNPADKLPFHGRNMVHRLNANGSNPTLILNHVELRKTMLRGIRQRDGEMTFTGDDIAFYDVAVRDAEPCFTDVKNKPDSITFDVNRISVHKTGGMIFECPDSNGVIETLSRGNNASLGDTGSLTINTDNDNSDSLVPDVPSRYEVGINSYSF